MEIYRDVDPATYLNLARQLATSTDAGAIRSAADRAYYATFLTSRDELAKKGYIVPYYTIDDHQYVAANLNRVCGSSAGSDEARLRRARNTITYDTRCLDQGKNSDVKGLKWMIETASRIIERVKALDEREQNSSGH